MQHNNLELAESYYTAMNNKDLSSMGKCLHDNISFLGPLAEITGKDAVLTAVSNLLPLFKAVTIRAKFSSDDKVMVAYDLDCTVPIGVLRIAALLTFENDLISRMELFFDARPFNLG
jgi:hypothetical protein